MVCNHQNQVLEQQLPMSASVDVPTAGVLEEEAIY